MLLIAHRTPATAAACHDLAAAGANVFEVDLQVDGGDIVVSHYLPVFPFGPARLRRDGWRVRWQELRAGAELLSAVVDRLPGDTELLLDLKDETGRRGDALRTLVLAAELDRSRCYVSAKNWAVLPTFRNAGFRTWRSVATKAALGRAFEEGSGPEESVTVRHSYLSRPGAVDLLKKSSARVIAWTVDDVARAAELRGLGVDGITSDSPQVFRALTDRL